ncbi:MAG: hypothetical protein NC218_01595 [Acetobacter sp.]|nr:hypothetical protein [Acetobacter sp.]
MTTNKVLVTTPESVPHSTLMWEVSVAINDRISTLQKQLERAFGENRINDAQDICDTLRVLMAYKVKDAE